MEKLVTLEEVAEFLRPSKDTVYRMANTGKITASKVGNQWRFRRDDVEQWIEEKAIIKPDESPEEA